MAGTTRKGVWDLQQVRDQYLEGAWEQQFELWSWGGNALGLNTTIQYSSPVQIPGTSWNFKVDGQYHSLATKTDGTLWAWCNNNGSSSGQLGQTDTTAYSSPVQIPGISWNSIAAGQTHSLATKTDGTLWAWGNNGQGQLGQSNTTNYSSPRQIPGTSWSSVGNGQVHSLATKTDGTLWAWGNNGNGQLGQGDVSNYSSPRQIPGTSWSSITGSYLNYHSLATKTDGTLWAWGRNGLGQLGQNNTTYYSSPRQIPGTQWSSIAIGQEQSLATKTDGTLWAWGYNLSGQLGQNNRTHYSSPVQIPGTTWSSISSGGEHSLALKSDNTLWLWGNNSNGRLGQGDRTNYSSPVQIPGTQWNSIADLGGNQSSALKTPFN